MSTPTTSTPVKGAPASATDSPGTWRHPRLNEITRRREATTFSEKNVRRIAYNIIALLCFWTIQLLVKMYIGPTSVSPALRLYISWAWTVVQLMPLVQVALACMPLFRARDEMTDIPLTDAQRKLLGLAPAPPASSPAKDLTFSTPPRYSRTPSIAGSVGSRGSYTNSPLSGRGSPFQSSTAGGGSPFSPPVDSPMLPKSGSNLFGAGANNRRSSSGSPFSASTSMNLFGDPTSPSPAGKRTSVGLNSKWLYEKGRRSSGSAWVH
ncbi:Nuclear pore complex component [Akanthomyces lecanii RCEF 1005]|uniref:Nuclear pore complex component n=1 Tax=Akanthomyces lecanii RCEF 1005 TaxID=1081108 RepID=A0A168FXV5_CORDF|nr:Nuclear pore complex component [Akanthomyces lecanii RCEF 1005]